jgi:hypothetical protein
MLRCVQHAAKYSELINEETVQVSENSVSGLLKIAGIQFSCACLILPGGWQ